MLHFNTASLKFVCHNCHHKRDNCLFYTLTRITIRVAERQTIQFVYTSNDSLYKKNMCKLNKCKYSFWIYLIKFWNSWKMAIKKKDLMIYLVKIKSHTFQWIITVCYKSLCFWLCYDRQLFKRIQNYLHELTVRIWMPEQAFPMLLSAIT